MRPAAALSPARTRAKQIRILPMTQSDNPAQNRPNRRIRLILWWLLYKIPVERELTIADELQAAIHCRVPFEEIEHIRTTYLRQWSTMGIKRVRRRCYFLQHGSIPDGWTPPDPLDRRSRNRPCRGASPRASARAHRQESWAKLTWAAKVILTPSESDKE